MGSFHIYARLPEGNIGTSWKYWDLTAKYIEGFNMV